MLSWLAWLQPASSRLLSVAGPWFLRLQCCGPGKGPALGSWAQRSLCPGPQYYHVSFLLETAETGLLAKAGTTQLSLPCQLSQLLQGTQGGGQQDQVNQLEPHVPRGPDGQGLMVPALPLELRPPDGAPWPLAGGSEAIQAGPLCVHSDRGWGGGAAAGMAAASLC